MAGKADFGKCRLVRCRRRYKSGILAGTKADRVLQRKSAENRGPNVGWRMFNDPEPEFWVVDEGDGGFSRACDLVVMALEIDGVVVVDATRLAEGEV